MEELGRQGRGAARLVAARNAMLRAFADEDDERLGPRSRGCRARCGRPRPRCAKVDAPSARCSARRSSRCGRCSGARRDQRGGAALRAGGHADHPGPGAPVRAPRDASSGDLRPGRDRPGGPAPDLTGPSRSSTASSTSPTYNPGGGEESVNPASSPNRPEAERDREEGYLFWLGWSDPDRTRCSPPRDSIRAVPSRRCSRSTATAIPGHFLVRRSRGARGHPRPHRPAQRPGPVAREREPTP